VGLCLKNNDYKKEWFYEGNISKYFVEYLKKNGHLILKDNSKNIKARGIDIISCKENILYLIEVKGYPSDYYAYGTKKGEKKRTHPNSQAKHWFAEVLLSTIINFSKNFNINEIECKYTKIKLLIVLPKFEKYIELVNFVKNYLDKCCDKCEKIEFYFIKKNKTIKKL